MYFILCSTTPYEIFLLPAKLHNYMAKFRNSRGSSFSGSANSALSSWQK